MSLLQPAKITSAYLKMGILGFQGGGKTKTAGKTAIGLYKYMQSKGIDCANKPVAFFDTETGSDWLIPDFQQAGVPFVVAKRRNFADLLAVVKEAEAGASVLIIDSITHPWRELCESYMRAKKRTFLQMDDWGYLKGEHGWAKFTDMFVNSKLHIIMCGRAGYEFEDYKDDNGKRQIEKVGTKMKTEGETGFEPSLLVLMEQVEDLRTGKVKHRATVQKDRSTLLDGEQIDNPDFKDFLPHIERLNLGGDHIGVDINGDSQHILQTEKRDWQPVQRKIALGEIEEILVRHYPGQTAADKKAKAELLRTHFKACWAEIETVMPLERLRSGYDTLHFTLEGEHSRYHQAPAPELNDSLPDHSAPTKPAGHPADARSSPQAQRHCAGDRADVRRFSGGRITERLPADLRRPPQPTRRPGMRDARTAGPRDGRRWGPYPTLSTSPPGPCPHTPAARDPAGTKLAGPNSMPEVAPTPFRPFDEAAALEWLRSQPDGRTNLRPAELGRRWGWTRQRTSRRLSTWAKDGLVKRRGKTITAADNALQNAVRKGRTKNGQRIDRTTEIHGSITSIVAASVPPPSAAFVPPSVTRPVTVIDAFAYTAAIGLAGIAAYFSIRGMTVLFPGAPTAIVVMGVAMEAGKLATVAWLSRHWRPSSWTVRNVLTVLIFTIAAINAAGVYSQLIAAHVGEHTAAVSTVGVQASALDARIEMQAHMVADLDARVAQIDATIAEATKRGRTAAALNIIEGQRKARSELVAERQREAGALASLRTERATVAARGKAVESEAAPIQYVAAVFGVTDPEAAIRWLVLFMTFACDPLAIALTAAASARRAA